MASLQYDSELPTETSETDSTESETDSPSETATEADDPAADESPDGCSDEPRSGSISSLLRRLEGVESPSRTDRETDTEQDQEEVREVSEMDAVLGLSEAEDEPSAADDSEDIAAMSNSEADDGYWGADGFERLEDDPDVRPDSYLLALISELNGKLDRTHDVISRSLPPTAPAPPAFEPPPVIPQRLFSPPRGRVREVLMFTGMWGSLIAAIIAVVYSNSWWLTEPPREPALASASNDRAVPARTQSLNRLGALGATALSAPPRPAQPLAGDPAPDVSDETTEPRRPPRPAAPDAPAASGDSATEAISSALAASGEEAPLEQGSMDEETTPPGVSAPDLSGDRPDDAVPVEEAPQETAPEPAGPTQHASSVTAVSEWRRVARVSAEPAPSESGRPAPDPAPGFAVGQVRGQAGHPIVLPIRVPQFAAETEASIMVRGLPEGSLLSAGERAGESTWILSMPDLPNLELMTPSDLAATEIALEITLVTSDGKVPSTKLLSIELAAAESAPEPVVDPDAPASAAVPANAQEAAELLGHGQELMKIGDIAGARLVLALAAELDNVAAMVALATTYDPVHLARLGVRGLRPDVHKAIAWYRRASEQGHVAARRRVEALVASAGR